MLCAEPIARPIHAARQPRPRLAIARPEPPRPKQLNLWADEPKPAPAPPQPRPARRTDGDYLPNDRLEAAILRGDRDEATRLLLALAARVVAVQSARRPLPPTLEPDDLVQLAVIDALRRLDSWEPGRSSAFSFATGSVKFTILAEVKRERRWLEVNRQEPDGEGAFDFADPASFQGPDIDRGPTDPPSVETGRCEPSSRTT